MKLRRSSSRSASRLLRTVLLAAALVVVAPVLGVGPTPATAPHLGDWTRLEAQTAPTVVYVVRHAERAEDGSDDPPISGTGQQRAIRVAGIFADAGLTHLHTTDYRRTRSTIAPTAQATGLEPEVYDPSDLEGFAQRLRATPGRHLVVGHSNTNAELVAALGGDGGPPIEEMEYDRGYVVVVRAAGATGSEIFRFGAPYQR